MQHLDAWKEDSAKKEEATKYLRQAIEGAQGDRVAMTDLAGSARAVLKKCTHKRKALEAVGVIEHQVQLLLDDVNTLLQGIYKIEPEFGMDPPFSKKQKVEPE